MATQVANDRLFTTDRDAEQAMAVLHDLRGVEGELAVSRQAHTSAIPDEIGRILQQVLETIARGGTINVTSMPDELTTSAAASLIGVSRPTVVKMVSQGELAARKVGSHTRIATSEVMRFLTERHERQVAAFAELRELLDD